jgi:dihydrofolate synthase/folylpolyglutamate synthase
MNKIKINKYFNNLYKLERTGVKYNLDNIRYLLDSLGNPQNNFKSIHIAGTNGKGAVASFLASILSEHGYKTGLYTSPHLLRFNERIQVNGRFISDNYIKKFFDQNIKFIKKTKASFFEATTALAFKYFSEQKVDIAIVEVGLGGRLDSTNVINPESCIITQIGIDHTQYLGHTLKSIAYEKLGILKDSKPVIISDNNKSLRIYFNIKTINNPVYFVDNYIRTRIINENRNRTLFKMNFIGSKSNSPDYDYMIPLNGKNQVRNASTAVLTANLYMESINKSLNFEKTKKALKKVKTNTFYHGRFEFISDKNKNYLFDVAHNPDAVSAVIDQTKYFVIDAIIFGIMKDKDYKTPLEHFKNFQSPVIFTKPSYHRARKPNDLYKYFIKQKVSKHDVLVENDLGKALKIAQGFCTKKGVIFIFGSFFLVSEAIRILKLQKYLN